MGRVIDPDLLAEEVELSFVRSSGPGGQNVNKVSSKAVARWSLKNSNILSEEEKALLLTRDRIRNLVNKDGEVVLNADTYRSQGRNKEVLLERLRELIQQGVYVQRKRKPTKPGRGARERRLKSKKERSQRKVARKAVKGDD